MERDLITYPTWEKSTVLAHRISSLSIRDRRRIFFLSRGAESGDVFFPEYGFTLYEFAVWHLLGESRRKGARREADG